jgi:hypothetical protein
MGLTVTDRISAESSTRSNIKILNLKPELRFTLEVIYLKSFLSLLIILIQNNNF